MLTIYGVPRSRTFRPLWTAHELGIPYTLEPVDMRNKLVNLVVLLRRQDPNDLHTVDLSSGDPVVQTR